MYSIYDYAYNGLLYLNNVMRPRHKRLSQLMIYSTTLYTKNHRRTGGRRVYPASAG